MCKNMETFYEIGKMIACGAGILTGVAAIYAAVKNFILKKTKTENVVDNFPDLLNAAMADLKKDLESLKHHHNEAIAEVKKDIADLKTSHGAAIDKLDEKISNNSDLTLSFTRDRLLSVLSKVMKEQAWDSVVEFRVTSKLYDSYIKNGGNTEIVAMYTHCEDLPVKDE